MTQPVRSIAAQSFTARIIAETDRISREEPQELIRLRTGTLEDCAGSYGQYFGTWDIAHGMLRDFSMYSLFPLLRIARHQKKADLSALCEEFFEPYTNYLGYSGLPQLEEFGRELRAIAKAGDNDETTHCLDLYVRYANRLYSWAYHYFPWGLGEQFRYPQATQEKTQNVAQGEGRVSGGSGRMIRMTWPELDLSIRAELAEDLNPELCADFLAAVPFTVLQSHPMVTGKSLFAWAPTTSTAPIQVREEILHSPKGRLRFSQRTGQKLVLQYGPCFETIFAPVLGQVVAEDIDKLDTLGESVWKSTYETKEQIWLRVELAD